MQGEAAVELAELELDAGRGRGGAVLDRHQEPLSVASQLEVAVAPGVQLGRAAQRLAGAGVTTLAGVVDEYDGAVEGALEGTQVREQGGDLRVDETGPSSESARPPLIAAVTAALAAAAVPLRRDTADRVGPWVAQPRVSPTSQDRLQDAVDRRGLDRQLSTFALVRAWLVAPPTPAAMPSA